MRCKSKSFPLAAQSKNLTFLPINTEGREVLNSSFSLLRCLRLLLFPFIHLLRLSLADEKAMTLQPAPSLIAHFDVFLAILTRKNPRG